MRNGRKTCAICRTPWARFTISMYCVRCCERMRRSNRRIDLRWQKRIADERQQAPESISPENAGKGVACGMYGGPTCPQADALGAGRHGETAHLGLASRSDNAHSSLVVKLALQLYDGISQCGILQLPAIPGRTSGGGCNPARDWARQDQEDGGGTRKRGYRMVWQAEAAVGMERGRNALRRGAGASSSRSAAGCE